MSDNNPAYKISLLIKLKSWAGRVGLGRKLVILLMIAALGMAVLTYAVLSGWAQFGTSGLSVKRVLIILNIDLFLFLFIWKDFELITTP